LEFRSPSEIRSDLYVERDGKQRRLTKGQRLVQPDARKDGTIIAVQLAATRTRLVLLDSNGRAQRLVRDGMSDETWSEPRWSPDGRSVAAVHRAHGGSFTLEIIDMETGESRVVERGPWLISSPAWSANNGAVYYVSEETGIPALMRATAIDGGRVPMQRAGEGNGIFSPDVSPSGRMLVAVALRADGYHVGVAGDTSPLRPAGPMLPPPPAAPVIESEPLATGEYHRYSPWRSALPRYWNPILENAPNGGVRLGATTSGRDVISRHIYELSAATTTTGTYPTASLVYRYAGLRRPFIDVDVSQDYTLEATLRNGGTTDVVGNLQRRTQSGSLGATFVRARVRTYTSLSFGGGLERRKFISDPIDLIRQLDPGFLRQYQYPSVFLAGTWSNTQRPTLSISAEDGVSLAVTARGRTRSDSVSDRASASVIGTASLFKSLDLPGYAHHVLALRVAGGFADRRAASSLQIGGTSSGTIQIIPSYTVGEGRRTFGVRGFPAGSVFGTRAATGTFEYRAPLGLAGKGIGSLPFFFDRSSVTAFVDAGVADCDPSPLNPTVCSSARLLGQTLASTGGELVLSAAIFDWDTPQKIRLGFAVPVAGRALVGARQFSVYGAYGLSF
ncbi:MAG: WD40-like beta Propeller containing protein, partial [Gemmatimonadetes bacterium]|nr:WD40-like beta Propeller containing protein [Gemmatimonadota bacterium]